ncbi:MAG: alpha/beta fold hydrolase [Alphaproteobacteria bacterium]|nr:alpha/beta fold hydrolase [Alphaproteobacteria bacterium]
MRYCRSRLAAAFVAFAVAAATLVSGARAHAAATPTAAAGLAPGAHTFQAGGVRLWYRVAGPQAGAPVVFLHGGPGEGSQTFAKFAGPVLERRLRMVYFDQRGSGRSERPKDPAAYSMDRLVEDIDSLRRQLGVDRISLIGHSFGTVLALEYAARYPDHVARVVLAASVPDAPAALKIQCRRLARTDPPAYRRALAAGARAGVGCNPFAAYDGPAQKAFVYRNMFPDPATGRLVDESDNANGLGNTGEMSNAVFNSGFLHYRFRSAAAVTAPVLIIAGGADHQAVVQPQRALAAALPRGRIVVLPGRGHFMFVEDPAGFGRLVVPFLSRPRR